jgi:hypothetical protein
MFSMYFSFGLGGACAMASWLFYRFTVRGWRAWNEDGVTQAIVCSVMAVMFAIFAAMLFFAAVDSFDRLHHTTIDDLAPRRLSPVVIH